MINGLSIDLEYWWSIELLKNCIPKKKDDLITESVDPLLKLLDAYDVSATFFVLGMVAEKYPELIYNIHTRGHEIGCHGYSHKTLVDLGEMGFEEDLKRAMMYLGKYHPIGYRAPSFSLNNDTLWALEILRDQGFLYDSSVFPIKTSLYGVPEAPVHIYRPCKTNIALHDPEGPIIEFPLTVLNMGKNIPIAGGFYIRALPEMFLKWGIRSVNKEKRPAIIYVHPWETYQETPRVRMLPPRYIVTYYGIASALKKLEGILKEFNFKPMREILHDL
ncbi:DUF3473 domain-containing protein [Methanoculleus sp. FWC-SCC1]|uniref:DUF3473 domain-containing protein n=1 Tax=Methanoculleus frigidifontis TaxID=2584085 RepID=A0ABT8MBN3_9EURY|nr:polysaccharide deacetylase family protein [Methanoculleus sp. FWC-SCC1]MDN7025350.1 DUF3473 domain-containing protein [Methanoculleus sp. FWC-SCC1]